MIEFSADSKARFDEDGYVAIRQFLCRDELTELSGKLNALITRRLHEMPPEHVFFEDKLRPDSLKQLQQIARYDPWLQELFVCGRFRELAELLLDGPVVPKNLQWFNKPPRLGQSTPPHQDGYYFMLDPCEAVTMWLALDIVDEENGCVRYVRGSQRDGMRAHGQSERLGFSQAIVDFGREEDHAREVAMPASPGDLLVHHALTIHRAGRNQSQDRNRRALGFIYYAERALEDKAAHQAYQRKLAESLLAKGKI